MSFRLTQSLSPNPYTHTTLIQTNAQNYCGHTYGFIIFKNHSWSPWVWLFSNLEKIYGAKQFIGTLFTIGIHKTYFINYASIKNIIQNNHLFRELKFSSTIQQLNNSKNNSFRKVKCLSFRTGGFWQWVLIRFTRQLVLKLPRTYH